MTFGEVLRSKRQEKGLSRQEIATLIGVNVQSYGSYENNRREPRYDTLKKIADVLETSIDSLLDFHPNEYEAFQKRISLFNDGSMVRRLPDEEGEEYVEVYVNCTDYAGILRMTKDRFIGMCKYAERKEGGFSLNFKTQFFYSYGIAMGKKHKGEVAEAFVDVFDLMEGQETE